jgi:hypothetical protein
MGKRERERETKTIGVLPSIFCPPKMLVVVAVEE